MSHWPFFFLWTVCSCRSPIFLLRFCSFPSQFKEWFICQCFIYDIDLQYPLPLPPKWVICLLTLFTVCSDGFCSLGKEEGKRQTLPQLCPSGSQATFVPSQAKKTAWNQMCKHPGAGETGSSGDQHERSDGSHTSSHPRAQGSQQVGWGWGEAALRGRPGVRSLHRLGLYGECEIPPELGRTWHLDSGEQSIPHPTQNEAWRRPVMRGEGQDPESVLLSGTLADSPRLWALSVPGWREKHQWSRF